MVLDHALVAQAAVHGHRFGADLVRTTITRASLPIFMVLAGALWAYRGLSKRRVAQVFAAGAFAMIVTTLTGGWLAEPNILAVLLLCLGLVELVRWHPAVWASLGLVQLTVWPIRWDGYQPGLVMALLALGALCNVHDLHRVGSRLPGFLERPGREALTWWCVHVAVLSALVWWAS